MDNNLELQCEQIHLVPPWIFARLKHVNCHDVRDRIRECNQEIKFGSRGEQIVDDLVVGDNVVVICESFWLLLCDKLVHSVKKSYIDDQGQTWYEGDNVIKCLWYEGL